jgi:hypothetical protein
MAVTGIIVVTSGVGVPAGEQAVNRKKRTITSVVDMLLEIMFFLLAIFDTSTILRSLHGDDDFGPGVALPKILESFSKLAERVLSIDNRHNLAGF